MADRYAQFMDTPLGRILSKQLGLPAPIRLERYAPGQRVIEGPVLFGAAAGGRLLAAVSQVLASVDAEVSTPPADDVRTAVAEAGARATAFHPDVAPADQTFKALVFDATGVASSEQLREAWAFFHPTIRRVRSSGRVIVLGAAPEWCEAPRAIAQRALEGLVRSVAKEVGHGATAQLVHVASDGVRGLESTLRFLLSARSAYVSGQVVRIGAAVADPGAIDWARPLGGRVALVTGASRGIGAAIAEVLARDGAHVVGLDVAAQGDGLEQVARRTGGSSLAIDITEPGAPAQIAEHLLAGHGGVDVVVHNAGLTRDKTLGRMTEPLWKTVLDVNLIAPQRIDRELFSRGAVRSNGRIICVSSITGIAGNAGQANYATSKAGVIGIVQAWAPAVAQRGATINAVAPGFIESRMTAAMPVAAREVVRRMNSLAQGGLPVDVAETIAWLASPGSAGITGNVVRVCGQSLLGA